MITWRYLDCLIDIMIGKIPGGVYGILSVAIEILLCLIALILTPHYIFFNHMISELGVGPGGIFFNLGLIFSGIIAIPFFISLGRTLNCEGINENLRKITTIISLISCVSTSLIGCFPAIYNNKIIFSLHGTFTFISWLCGLIFLILFSINILKVNIFSKIQAYLGFVVAGVYALVLCTWWPITEYALIFAVSIWIVINASYILYHKIQYNTE